MMIKSLGERTDRFTMQQFSCGHVSIFYPGYFFPTNLSKRSKYGLEFVTELLNRQLMVYGLWSPLNSLFC